MTRSLASLSSSLSFRRSSSARLYSLTTSLALVTPLLAALLAGFLYPVARLITLSFSGGTLSHYRRIFAEPVHLDVLFSTIEVAFVVAVASLLLGFPIAYLMARLSKGLAMAVAACVFIPLWTSVLIRSYAWVVLLQRNGIINRLLIDAGVTEGPLKMI
jgi:mannopine transport system permease protein